MLRHARQIVFSAAMPVLLLAGWVCAGAADQPGAPSATARDAGASARLYVSDYFSFVGEDAQGHVALALDNNRGRDGEAYQAEHFVVLHDERQGWVDVKGNGPYDNTAHELWGIPDSPHFKFEGIPTEGLTITSESNRLALRIEQMPIVVARQHQGGKYWMGGAPAVLEWAGRTLKGRVIYEYVFLPEFNRLTRTYPRLWRDYQGLYLTFGGVGDLYMHSQQSGRLADLAGEALGFAVQHRRAESLDNVRLTATGHALAPGVYRWPTEWQVQWKRKKPWGGASGADIGLGTGSGTLTLHDRKSFGNWFIGGFAMGIVKGEVTINGRAYPIYGLAELLI